MLAAYGKSRAECKQMGVAEYVEAVAHLPFVLAMQAPMGGGKAVEQACRGIMSALRLAAGDSTGESKALAAVARRQGGTITI